MSGYICLRTVHGPYGTVEVSRKPAGFFGGESYHVKNLKTGKYALLSDYDDAMRKAFEFVGRKPSDYRPGE